MSLFGSLMGDVEDDPFFGSHMRTMRQMNNMMNSLFSDPFGMMGGGPLAIGGPRHHGSSLMPFMPQMPSLDRLFAGNMDGMGPMGASSYSSSTVVMSSGPNGKPQVYSSSSSTKIGPNGIKETRNTLQDSRTGTKKMSIGHHIGERAHVIEREQNVYSGDAEERQEFINIEEEEAEDFDREFQVKAGSALGQRGSARAITSGPPPPAHTHAHVPRREPMLALPPAPSAAPLSAPDTSAERARAHSPAAYDERSERGERGERRRPASRRPIRAVASPLTTSPSVREVYGSSHPQRHRHKHHKSHRHSEH